MKHQQEQLMDRIRHLIF